MTILTRDFPDVRNVLVLVPHPDDEALSCGGTLSLLAEKGAFITACYVTSGERLLGEPSPDVAEFRIQEARSAAGSLGCRQQIFLEFPDGNVSGHAEEITVRLAEIAAELKPDIVLAPSLLDFHADHMALSEIALALRDRTGIRQVAFFEIYTTQRFNCLVEISETIERKKKAIMGYSRSLYGKPGVYVHAALGLNAQRSIFTQRQGYYEAFYFPGEDETAAQVRNYLTYGV